MMPPTNNMANNTSPSEQVLKVTGTAMLTPLQQLAGSWNPLWGVRDSINCQLLVAAAMLCLQQEQQQQEHCLEKGEEEDGNGQV